MAWDPRHPYDDLPSLPPSAELETRRVLKETIAARDRLARLDTAARRLPNPTVLINAIPLIEAQASSEIENIVTTTDELFSAAQSPASATSPAAREALRYRKALREGFDAIARRPVTSRTADRVCSTLRGHEVTARAHPVYIGDPVTQRRVYTPPERPGELGRLLDNWSDFVNDHSDLDPLVRMAVAHYQFEAIHPYTDGNGRTGRILNVLMLCASGLLHSPVLYLSRHIIETKDEYYRRLLAVTADQAWEDWICYMLDAVRETASRTLDLVGRIEEAERDVVATMRRVLGLVNGDLVSVLMEQPYARTRDVLAGCGVSRPTAAKWLRGLTEAGLLDDIRVGREVLYLNRPLMEVLRNP